MTIKSELQCIELELDSIDESRSRIKLYVQELNKLNPLSVGDELTVNGWSHQGKTLVADKIFVSDSKGNDASITAQKPVYFTASGTVKRQNGSLGSYTGVHNIEIDTLITKVEMMFAESKDDISDTVTITREQLREVVGEHLSFFEKDVSNASHDIRKYEYADDKDFDEFTDNLFNDLSLNEQPK